MKDDTRELLDSILADWHRWCRSYTAMADVGSSPMFKQTRSNRQWDTVDDVIEREIDGGRMEAVDFHIGELEPVQRTALQINARNICTGKSVWNSVRLPADVEARAVLLVEARAALTLRLMAAGIL